MLLGGEVMVKAGKRLHEVYIDPLLLVKWQRRRYQLIPLQPPMGLPQFPNCPRSMLPSQAHHNSSQQTSPATPDTTITNHATLLDQYGVHTEYARMHVLAHDPEKP